MKAYEDRFAELNSVIEGLQKQVGDLERKVANKSVDHTPLLIVNETENQPITNLLVDSESKAVNTLNLLLYLTEKEKASRRLNFILHNVVESSASEWHVRKE